MIDAYPKKQCGVLLGALAMRHAYDCGCKKAELLAINDDERTHALLKAFYRTYVRVWCLRIFECFHGWSRS